MNDLRVVIDTNVVVSAVLLPRSVPRKSFDLAATHGKLLLSASTSAEFNDVLRRPKFDKYIERPRRLEFLAAFIDTAEAVEIVETVIGCRDPKDDKYLELAVNGRASHLITDDADLLALDPFRSISIVTPQAFIVAINRPSIQ
jgi:putative PIN family toxin of toxin-antitoxin system